MEFNSVDHYRNQDAGKDNADAGWLVVGAAVRGTSHEQNNLPCQDAVGYRKVSGGYILAAVADGAGSAMYSDQGAWAAVNGTLGYLESSLNERVPADAEEWSDQMRGAFLTARKAVLALAERSGGSPRDFACTLAAAVASADGMVAGLVGDGVIVYRDGDGNLFSAIRVQRGEYANETRFLVEEDALDMAEVEWFDCPVSALALMSDGLIRLAMMMPAQEPHAPFFQPLFRFTEMEAGDAEAVNHLAHFLNSARVNERTDDDKALILAVARGVHARGEHKSGGFDKAGIPEERI